MNLLTSRKVDEEKQKDDYDSTILFLSVVFLLYMILIMFYKIFKTREDLSIERNLNNSKSTSLFKQQSSNKASSLTVSTVKYAYNESQYIPVLKLESNPAPKQNLIDDNFNQIYDSYNISDLNQDLSFIEIFNSYIFDSNLNSYEKEFDQIYNMSF